MLQKLFTWGVCLGTYFGVPLYIHGSTLLFLLLCTLLSPVWGAIMFLSLWSVIPHEYGHILAARYYGVKCRNVLILPVGGVATLEGMPREWVKEFWITAFGPLVSLTLCIWSLPFAYLLFEWTVLPALFCLINGGLFLFNCLPIFPMDGGRIFRCLLYTQLDYKTATWYAVRIGQGLAILTVLVMLITSNILGAVTMGFIAWMSEAELKSVG